MFLALGSALFVQRASIVLQLLPIMQRFLILQTILPLMFSCVHLAISAQRELEQTGSLVQLVLIVLNMDYPQQMIVPCVIVVCIVTHHTLQSPLVIAQEVTFVLLETLCQILPQTAILPM